MVLGVRDCSVVSRGGTEIGKERKKGKGEGRKRKIEVVEKRDVRW